MMVIFLLALLSLCIAEGTEGWEGKIKEFSTQCNIPRLDLTVDQFRKAYRGRYPVILKRPGSQQYKNMTLETYLRENHNDTEVILASSNTYSHDKKRTTLGDYLDNYMQPLSPTSRANDTWYFFGDVTESNPWTLNEYEFPPGAEEDHGAKVWGIGGKYSGVPFHKHGSAYAEVIHGSKFWALYPHTVDPRFDPNESLLNWLLHSGDAARARNEFTFLPQLDISEAELSTVRVSSNGNIKGLPMRRVQLPLLCLCHPDEILYIPNEWYHATLNLDDYNVFVSTFVQEHLFSVTF